MRITNQLQYRQNLQNYQFSQSNVYDLNEKLASKMQITNPYEDTGIYVDATRLDYEGAVLEQVKEATTKAKEFAQNTDQTLGDFMITLDSFKVKLVQAANEGVHSVTSRVAIANDLQAMRDQLVTVANTAINGQYLFAGTAINTKPISDDGMYHGNDKSIEVQAGVNRTIAYNIDGQGLFLGRDNDYQKQVTTNITLINKHEELNPQTPEAYIKTTDSIYQLIGTDYQSPAKNAVPRPNQKDGKMDYISDFDPADIRALPPTVFFMQGERPDGQSFSVKFELTADASISDLMEQMGNALGNTSTNKMVEVSLNPNSQIQVTNLQNGNEIMTFSMFALTAMEGTAAEIAAGNLWDTAAIENATDLETIQQAVKDGKVHLNEFISSPNYLNSGTLEASTTDYDKTRFEKNGASVTGNASQIVRSDNTFANEQTRISQVAALSSNGANKVGINGGAVETLADADDLVLDITTRKGDVLKATIDFNGTITGTAPDQKFYPTITITDGAGAQVYQGNFYRNVWNENLDLVNDPTGKTQIGNQAIRVETDDLTYKELNDMITILANGNLDVMQGQAENIGAGATDAEIQAAHDRFNTVLQMADLSVETSMTKEGYISVKDKTTSSTKIEIAMYQEHGNDDYPAAVGTDQARSGSVLSFNRNDSLIIDNPTIDFFGDLDKMIQSVRDGSFWGNPDSVNPRTTGVQGAIERLDHLMDHISKEHSIAGSNSRHITDTFERATTLSINVAEVKSSVIDADYGELAMQFQERLLAYQAMLAATSKINNISLLNYM